MKIHFEQTGGFTGIPTAATIDTLALTSEEAQQLHDLIQAAAFFNLPGQLTKSAATVPDQFHYKVIIQDEGQTHTLETTDAAAPPALRPLLRHLTHLARRL